MCVIVADDVLLTLFLFILYFDFYLQFSQWGNKDFFYDNYLKNVECGI